MNDTKKTATTAGQTGGVKVPKVNWDDSQMSTSYANVVNAVSSREEFTLFFGTNQSWNPKGSELSVKLSDRVILNPHAAKRLLTLLGSVMAEYEKRFGTVNIEISSPSANPSASVGGSTDRPQ